MVGSTWPWGGVALSPSMGCGLHSSEALSSAAVSPSNASPPAFPRAGGGRWMLKGYLKALGDVHGPQWDMPPEQCWDPGRDLWLQLFSLL